MKHLLSVLFFIPLLVFSQVGQVNITVYDGNSTETIPFASVRMGDFRGLTDDFGKISFSDVPYGKYTLIATMLDSVSIQIDVKQPILQIETRIKSPIELEEVKVTGSFIRDERKTPISVTKIEPQKIQEELASRDIPMLLNATPGVYATQQGGGEGDARVSVRGFSQRNVGVLIDGVPVNDMENGAVYWSNWFGLDVITGGIQVQRGLGATKISMPSVGGTINILTQGITSKMKVFAKQEYGSGNLLRTSVGYNSGLLKGGWGITLAASFKKSDGTILGTPSLGGFYYAKIQKRLGNHLLSFSVFGAPQKHAQRAYNQKIQYWDSTAAINMGATITSASSYDNGYDFNEHWGYINKDYKSKNVFQVGGKSIYAERLNYFLKNQLTLKDFWVINEKLSMSNIVYASIGKGGGTKLLKFSSAAKDENGQVDWNAVIKNNQEIDFFGQVQPTVDPNYSPTLLKASNVMTSSVNNHYWVGYLGQFDYEITKNWNFAAGLDYRFYRGEHYREITDLLGGDYFINNADKNSKDPMKKVGDKIAEQPYEAHRYGYVQWAGMFAQAEFSNARWSAFINVTGNVNGYSGVDFFRARSIQIDDTTLYIGAFDTITYNGEDYTTDSKGVDYDKTGYKWIPGGTVKIGANYIIAEHSNVFLNLGYLSRNPMYSNVIDNTYNHFFNEIKNEIIQAVEVGYNFRLKKVAFSVNGYFTNWKNKPFPNGLAVPNPDDPMETIRVNIQGMDAIHMGIEFDGVWKIIKQLSLEASISYGDWTWNSSKTIVLPAYNKEISFDAKGVHVGDAPQSMYMAGIRIDPIKHLYFKIQYQYFDRFYSDFNPFILKGQYARHESWKAPSYGLLNIYGGYKFIFGQKTKYALTLNASVINTIGTRYISDAVLSNTYGPGFDINSVGVMYGPGLKFNVGLSFDF
ncbi:MAG: TonB-dependent receptor [Brumimicrobium sp.]|nr:TonB-dependent receptor [Brumimicrobium sp.]